MSDYKLTEASKKDLRGISAYTKKTWGNEQEKEYREILRTTLKALAKNPKIGQTRNELAKGLLSFPMGRHIAYYVETKNGIEVARILHSAMDQEKALHLH